MRGSNHQHRHHTIVLMKSPSTLYWIKSSRDVIELKCAEFGGVVRSVLDPLDREDIRLHQDRHHTVVLMELFPDTLLDRSPGIVIELNVC